MSIFKKDTTNTDKKAIDDKKSAKKETNVKAVKKEATEEKKTVMKDLYAEGSSKSKKEKVARGKHYSESYRVLVKPLVTEKASEMGKLSKYAFEIDKKSNKIMVARAIEDVYGVKPQDVNVVNVKGKKKRTGRVLGKRKDWKKAIVTLPRGKTIQIYEGV